MSARVIPFPALRLCTAESDDVERVHICTAPVGRDGEHSGDHLCVCGLWWSA